MDFSALLILALATWQTVEIWHHSKLFASWRAIVQTWAGWWYYEQAAVERLHHRKLARLRLWLLCQRYNSWAWLSDLLTCPWCLSVWVGVALYLCWLYIHVGLVVIYGLAVSRLANVFNDLTHAYCRTPRAGNLKTGFEKCNEPDNDRVVQHKKILTTKEPNETEENTTLAEKNAYGENSTGTSGYNSNPVAH